MKRLLVLGAIVAAVALAACGGGSGGNGSATHAAAGGSAGTVAVQNVGNAGRILVDSSGKALYESSQEASGMVLCTNGCDSFWRPLTIKGGRPTGSVPGKLGVVKRPDGSRQVTFDRRPIYSFNEEGPGKVTGDGFHDAFDGRQFTWHVVSVDGGSSGASGNTGSSSGSSSNGGGFSY